MFELHAPGVFVVRYRTSHDMEPGGQAPLVDAIRTSAGTGHVGLVFDVEPGVHWVDVGVPTFWLRTVSDPSLRIRAMAIVTESSAVRIAAAGFATACAIRQSGLEVRTFRSRAPALAWVTETAAPPSPVPVAG